MSLTGAEWNGQRELAYRANNGIEVILFWHEGSGAVMVAVSDANSGAYFELAADPAHALDVFEHPYAYAAFMGVPYDEEPLASWAHAADQPPVATAGAGGASS
jgi:hypothetical protein